MVKSVQFGQKSYIDCENGNESRFIMKQDLNSGFVAEKVNRKFRDIALTAITVALDLGCLLYVCNKGSRVLVKKVLRIIIMIFNLSFNRLYYSKLKLKADKFYNKHFHLTSYNLILKNVWSR